MKKHLKSSLGKALCVGIAVVTSVAALCTPSYALRIRDVARLQNEVPNEIVGMGLVVGLKGTGDGGDYMGAIRPLAALMQRFENPVALEKELKNASNVAIVQVRVMIPAQGAHAGEKLDVKVASIGAAKSLKGGQLIITPLISPAPPEDKNPPEKRFLGTASGECMIDDANPTTATINAGGVLIEDFIPDEILDKDGQFSLILHPNTANMETATAVADQINEDVSAQTGGKPAAMAVDATSVRVTIPRSEIANITGFISRIRNLPLPNIPETAKVIINTKTKTIVFTEEVELAPTTVICGSMTIKITATPPTAGGTGNAAADARQSGTAKLRDLVDAFNLYQIKPDERIAIVKQLHATNVLKAELEIQ